MQTILLGVSSGIAAFKVIDLIHALKKKYKVIVITTENAKKMLPLSEIKKTGVKIINELFPKEFNYKKILKKREVEHIKVADTADLICIIPATANVIAKIALGIADDLLTTTILASKAPLLICPSMNVNMWKKNETQRNLALLRKKGSKFVMPESGDLACGYEGLGRLADINRINEEITSIISRSQDLIGKKIVVTAGGTSEPIDDVRSITNKSSGKMGIAIADECVKRGARVTLLKGRTKVEPMLDMKIINIGTAKEMANEIKKVSKKTDIIICAAAVGDFTIERRKGKIKSKSQHVLKLMPSMKIIKEIKKWNKDIFLVGFKAEKKELIKSAKKSLKNYNGDLIIANKTNNIGSDYNEVYVLDKYGRERLYKKDFKEKISCKIVDEIYSRISKPCAFVPANISMIFQLYESNKKHGPGSLGVGITIDKGAKVYVKRARHTQIYVNNKKINFSTVEYVLKKICNEPVRIDIKGEVPFGCGFGMSGASALGTAYAINKLFSLAKSNKELALIAHQAEIACGTGRGDIAGQFNGGIMIRRNKENPLKVENLEVEATKIYYKVFGCRNTKEILKNKKLVEKINAAGLNSLAKINKKLKYDDLVKISLEFSKESGLINPKIYRCINNNLKNGINSSMIMLGDAVFSNQPFKESLSANIVWKGATLL